MTHPPDRPAVVNAFTTPFLPYDLEGPVQPEMSWLPLSFDRDAQSGTYLMRMEPGAATIAHEHPGVEEFLVIEGDLVDSDGTVYGPGDFVSYEAGTRHNSWTEGGCLLAVFEWRRGGRRSVVTTAAQSAASSGGSRSESASPDVRTAE